MNHDRNAFITAYRAMYGGTEMEADRALRGVELAYAEREHDVLHQALDNADGRHMKEVSALREQIASMNRIMEAFPDTHMRFGIAHADGTVEEPEQCADWCYACKLEKLQDQVNKWKTYEADARKACMQFAELHGHFGVVLANIQAGQYDEALTFIKLQEQRRLSRTGRTVISIVAVEDNYGKLDCCDEEEFHVWVQVLTWSGRRAYLTGASPFMEAAGLTAQDVFGLTQKHFYADLPLEPPPAEPESGEQLEWPNLELAPPLNEIEKELGIN